MKVLSLDFRGTIALSNREYSRARIKLISGMLELAEDEAQAKYQFIKRKLDHDAEAYGTSVTPLAACEMFLGEVKKENVSAHGFLLALEKEVMKNPPLLHPNISYWLDMLKCRGWIVGVSSNTNFIRGSLIQEIFNLPWDFQVYSDEVGLSKPAREFFYMARNRVASAGNGVMKELVHVGDNFLCDVKGSTNAGFKGILTNGPGQTIDIMKELVEW